MTAPIRPGATIGLLGGGQLGRMTAMAARTMGYDIRVLDPDPHCPAAALATETIVAGFDDEVAAARLAEQCAVVTLEIEQISRVTLEAASRFAPLRPGVEPVYIIQERGRQKEFLASHGFPVGPFRVVTSAAECAAAIDALGPSIVKSVMGGYDGRGQARVRSSAEGTAAWESVGGRRAVVERFLDLADEVSVLVARTPDGVTRAFPPARNHHAMGILTWSVLPGDIEAALAERATALAVGVTEALGIVGLLGVEMFVLGDGTLLVNELAPRPHNTYHHTERACVTSQFEQLVRAVCGLPLGATDVVRPAAIHNLLGDLWTAGPPDFTPVLARPGVRLHLYGKREARPGRKMGHLSACGDTSDEALARVLEAYALVAP